MSYKKMRAAICINILFGLICITVLQAQSVLYPLQKYDSISTKIIKTALTENKAIELLTELCTTIGHRLTGSPQAERAVVWSKEKMVELGFQNVRTERVTVKRWIRGKEEGFFQIDNKKLTRKINICAYGNSIGTPKEGITSEIVEIKTWEELKEKGDELKGKIAFYNRPMDRSLISLGTAYAQAVDQRSNGAIEAAKYGAVAALVRSMTTRIDDKPHTGQMHYVDSIPKIPSAAISTIDADIISGLIKEGNKVKVTLKLVCDTMPQIESVNVLGEIFGSEKPNEIILIGAHLDSWDKGQGAHDDAAGCVHVIEALRLIKELDLKPKRTIRVVLFMNEENGLDGGLT